MDNINAPLVQDTSTAAIAALMDGVTKGRPVQFHPFYCPEAKGAPAQEWDTSHDLSVIREDGTRYKIGHFHHSHDALFDQLARQLVPALVAERDAAIARAEQAEAETERLKADRAQGQEDYSSLMQRYDDQCVACQIALDQNKNAQATIATLQARHDSKVDALEAKLAKAAKALEDLADCVDDGCLCSEMKMGASVDEARATLAEIKGKQHD